MANFSYQAINESGTTISGIIQADSVENAENLLLSKGYIPSKVAAARRGSSSSLLEKIDQALGHVKITDLILFSKQFRSMMQAGVPILRLLTVLENQTETGLLEGQWRPSVRISRADRRSTTR
jgi:type IV pilus assembly protein PilC